MANKPYRIEIEVKAKLTHPEKVRASLAALGCVLSAPITQDDVIYKHKDELTASGPGKTALRIRRTPGGGAAYFTLKQNRSGELDCIEQETAITDPQAMHEALLLMDYIEMAHVTKVREKTTYNRYAICLDVVEGLGPFIEIEEMSEDGDGEAIQKKLFAFLQELGVEEGDRVMQGYDTLMEIGHANRRG